MPMNFWIPKGQTKPVHLSASIHPTLHDLHLAHCCLCLDHCLKGLLRTINNMTEYQNSLYIIGYTVTQIKFTESVEIYCFSGILFNLLNKAKSSKPFHSYRYATKLRFLWGDSYKEGRIKYCTWCFNEIMTWLDNTLTIAAM